jgi:hypothetical protein
LDNESDDEIIIKHFEIIFNRRGHKIYSYIEIEFVVLLKDRAAILTLLRTFSKDCKCFMVNGPGLL